MDKEREVGLSEDEFRTFMGRWDDAEPPDGDSMGGEGADMPPPFDFSESDYRTGVGVIDQKALNECMCTPKFRALMESSDTLGLLMESKSSDSAQLDAMKSAYPLMCSEPSCSRVLKSAFKGHGDRFAAAAFDCACSQPSVMVAIQEAALQAEVEEYEETPLDAAISSHAVAFCDAPMCRLTVALGAKHEDETAAAAVDEVSGVCAEVPEPSGDTEVILTTTVDETITSFDAGKQSTCTSVSE